MVKSPPTKVLLATVETNTMRAVLTAEAGAYSRAALHGATVCTVCKLKQKRIENTIPEQTEQAAAGGFDSRCHSTIFRANIPRLRRHKPEYVAARKHEPYGGPFAVTSAVKSSVASTMQS
jgi:hypothetical protein